MLTLEHVAILPTGPTLSMTLEAGQTLAVVGPAGGGKSRLLRTLAGQDRPAQGTVRLRGKAFLAQADAVSRRARPQVLARKAGDASSIVTDILLTTRLWDVRSEAVGDLSPSQVAACELVELLASGAEALFIDGQLDRLDPWTLASILAKLKDLVGQGRVLVVATNRPDLLRHFDAVVVLKDSQVRFAGGIPELLRVGPTHTLFVSTGDQAGVQALVAPFEVLVEEKPDGILLHAREGQELAAKLLLEGYGDIHFIVSRPPTLEEALLGL